VRLRLRNPDRDVDVTAGRTVREILDELGINADAVLVIPGGNEDRQLAGELSDEVLPAEIYGEAR